MRDGHALLAKGRPRLISDAPFALSSKKLLLIALSVSLSPDVGRTALVRVETTDLGTSENRLVGSADIAVASRWLRLAGGRKSAQLDRSLARRWLSHRLRLRGRHLARGLFLSEEPLEERDHPRGIGRLEGRVQQLPTYMTGVNIW